ncbi:MAG: hypothetical protein UX62_C0033G0010 [Microgenomates group bacterium GW2011_GWA2_46_7]|nr:MAG: hypothetical protein UX62_C0033G0010 [Microgenomates group bacterium GW2011_GWA2_46_7]
MEIYKRLTSFDRMVTLHGSPESKTLEYLMRLFDEAKKDFPGLTIAEVSLQIPTGEWGGRLGISFEVPEGTEIPDCYKN